MVLDVSASNQFVSENNFPYNVTVALNANHITVVGVLNGNAEAEKKNVDVKTKAMSPPSKNK